RTLYYVLKFLEGICMAIRQDASTGQLVEDNTVHDPPAGAAKKQRDILAVKVWSPFKVYFDGEATSVSGINATGPFDILPQHHNFITLLNSGELALNTRQGDIKIRISGGVMQVHQDTVTVFLEV